MKQQNITVLRKILYAVESGGQVYGRQNYSAFAGVGANTPNEKAITIGAGQWYAGEARLLLQNIQKKYPKDFSKLDTAGIAGTDMEYLPHQPKGNASLQLFPQRLVLNVRMN